jgi:hypothetical protein
MTQPQGRATLARMSGGDWSDRENDAVVAAYFAMLGEELAGKSYNKAAQNRLLQDQTGRSRGSIEFKLSNVSAALKGFALPMIAGYQPRFNFQLALAEAVSRWLARHPEWETRLIGRHDRTQAAGLAEPQALFVGVAPTLRNAPPPEETEKLQAVARHFDVAGRDERNRALIETAKLNGLDPEACLQDMLTRIADHPVNRIVELLPWNITAKGCLQ